MGGVSVKATTPLGVELIDNTLQIITSMQQKRRELEAENQELKDRIAKIEMSQNNMDYEKSKYMEGAVWYGRKITNEIERLCHAVETLVREFVYRESQSSSQYGFGRADRNQTWFTEAIKKASMDLYENAIMMLESAIHNMDEATANLTQTNNQDVSHQPIAVNTSGFPRVENLLTKPSGQVQQQSEMTLQDENIAPQVNFMKPQYKPINVPSLSTQIN